MGNIYASGTTHFSDGGGGNDADWPNSALPPTTTEASAFSGTYDPTDIWLALTGIHAIVGHYWTGAANEQYWLTDYPITGVVEISEWIDVVPCAATASLVPAASVLCGVYWYTEVTGTAVNDPGGHDTTRYALLFSGQPSASWPSSPNSPRYITSAWNYLFQRLVHDSPMAGDWAIIKHGIGSSGLYRGTEFAEHFSAFYQPYRGFVQSQYVLWNTLYCSAGWSSAIYAEYSPSGDITAVTAYPPNGATSSIFPIDSSSWPPNSGTGVSASRYWNAYNDIGEYACKLTTLYNELSGILNNVLSTGRIYNGIADLLGSAPSFRVGISAETQLSAFNSNLKDIYIGNNALVSGYRTYVDQATYRSQYDTTGCKFPVSAAAGMANVLDKSYGRVLHGVCKNYALYDEVRKACPFSSFSG